MSKKGMDTADVLVAVLDLVLRYEFNVNKREMLHRVYGFPYGDDPRTDYANKTNEDGYVQSKMDMLESRGFNRWYCDLDLGNQLALAKLMLERYPDLKKYLKGEQTDER